VNDNCILVFTSRTIERMKAEGGSQAWVLDATRARTYPYLVCSWNPTGEFAQANQGLEHGEGFLVAPIAAVEPAPESPDRYILRFTEFARVKVANVWRGKRNPVNYTTLSELGIDPDSLAFEKAERRSAPEPSVVGGSPSSNLGPLSISAVKPRLAAYYNVPVEAIEIIIRG
jgi:hypothetical protein